MKYLLLALGLLSSTTVSPQQPGIFIEEEKQDYLTEDGDEAQDLLEADYISFEEEQEEHIPTATAIRYDTRIEPTVDGFKVRIYVIYNDNSYLTIWQHLAREFNKKLSLDQIVELP